MHVLLHSLDSGVYYFEFLEKAYDGRIIADVKVSDGQGNLSIDLSGQYKG